MGERLSKDDWIRQGLSTLADAGVNALKVGPMAQALKVSRGSFYWHFADIGEFRGQLLKSWQQNGTEEVIRNLEAMSDEPDRLKHLMRRAFLTEASLDHAVRAWATQDVAVAVVVAAVDARRVDYIAGLLAAAGVEAERARRRAAFIYWAYLGQAVMMDARHATITAGALDEISELFER